jgi:LPS-assembly protein
MTNAFALGVNMDEAKTVKSDSIEYDIKSQELKTSGNTEVTNASGQRIKLDNISISKNNSKILANDIELWLGSHVYIKASEITRDNQETIAKDAIFTACDGCDDFGNTWEISGTKIIHDAGEKMLYFHNSIFWLYNDTFPMFWLPYYEMPDPSVKYKTGFLTPSFNTTNGMGTQINIPFYINISDRHDLTPTFSYLTNENPLFQLEHRLNLKHSEFRTKGSFTHNKMGENRWHIYNDDKIELGENARATVYVQRTSDKTYLQKYGFYDYQPYLDSGAKLELFGQTSYIVADTHIFQELREPTGNQTSVSGNILPNVRGVYQTNPLFAETYLNLSGDILGVSTSNSSSQRMIGEAQIVSPWTLWGGNRFTASVSARYDLYNFDNTTIYDDDKITDSYSGIKSRFLPSGFVEWGLPLFSVNNDWTYIIEPRARLTVMERTASKSIFAYNNDSAGRFLSDTTLFSNNRYAGLDVWENGNFADYGARWMAFNSNHNIEIFVGQTYDFNTPEQDFNDNGFRNGFSDYVGRIVYSNNKNIQLSSRFRFDRNDMNINHAENSIYIGKNNTFFTLGHIWDSQPIDIYSTNDKDTHEMIGGAGVQITKRINIKGSAIYNIYNHVFQRHSGGIFYNHPCYYLSFEYHRDNAVKDDYVGGTTFQFKFGMSIDGKHY